MKKIITCVTIALFNLVLYAQNDTIHKEQNTIIEVYDVVAVYKEHIDGRGRTRQFTSEIKGEILNYDESTGVLTFKGMDGKMYSFKSSDYKYFEYNKEFTSKNKQNVILPRKDSGFEFSAGMSASYINFTDNFTADAYYLAGWGGNINFPGSIKVGVSKYLNKNSLVGLTAEYALLTFDKSYFNVGARYQYVYNPNKNSAFYFPAELKFSHYQFDTQYQTSDTTFTDDLNYEYPSRIDTDISINSLELNVGQGVSFALKNKRSVSLELMLLKQFALTKRFKNSSNLSPNSEIGITGVKLAVFMNF